MIKGFGILAKGAKAAAAAETGTSVRMLPGEVSKEWRLISSEGKRYHPTGVELPKQSVMGELRGGFKLPTIRAEIAAEGHTVPVFGQTGSAAELEQVARTVGGLPTALVKGLDSVDMWTVPNKPVVGVPTYGVGFIRADAPAQSRWGKTVVSFGGALREYGSAKNMVWAVNDQDRVRVMITPDHLRIRLQGKAPHRDPAAWEKARTGGRSPLHGLGRIGEESGLVNALAPHAYRHLTDAQRSAYWAAVKSDGGVAFATARKGGSVALDAASAEVDFSGALQTLAIDRYVTHDYARLYPARYAFFQKLFTEAPSP